MMKYAMNTGMAMMVLKAKVKIHQRWVKVMCLVWKVRQYKIIDARECAYKFAW